MMGIRAGRANSLGLGFAINCHAKWGRGAGNRQCQCERPAKSRTDPPRDRSRIHSRDVRALEDRRGAGDGLRGAVSRAHSRITNTILSVGVSFFFRDLALGHSTDTSR